MRICAQGIILAVALCALSSGTARADTISSCDGALVRDTYGRVDQQHADWRLAARVDHDTYDVIKKELSGSGTIFGVDAGAGYKDFQKNITHFHETIDSSFSQDNYRNVLWTYLDQASSGLYHDCLAHLKSQPLMLLPRFATDNEVTFDLQYNLQGLGPNPIHLKWQGAATRQSHLPATAVAGPTPIVLHRPTSIASVVLTVQGTGGGAGSSDQVIITPPPPKLSGDDLYPDVCTISSSPTTVPTIAPRGHISWQCGGLKKGTYSALVDISLAASDRYRVHATVTACVLHNAICSSNTANSAGNDQSNIYSGQFDVNIPHSGLPDHIYSQGALVFVSTGQAVQFTLNIDASCQNNNFPNCQGTDGSFSIPSPISIKLVRLDATP